MPEETLQLVYNREITAEEFANISQGLVPEEMEDKWFIYLEGSTLFFHRSWTGICIFRIEISPTPNGYQIKTVEVNNSQDQYRLRSAGRETELISTLVEYMCSERQ